MQIHRTSPSWPRLFSPLPSSAAFLPPPRLQRASSRITSSTTGSWLTPAGGTTSIVDSAGAPRLHHPRRPRRRARHPDRQAASAPSAICTAPTAWLSTPPASSATSPMAAATRSWPSIAPPSPPSPPFPPEPTPTASSLSRPRRPCGPSMAAARTPPSSTPPPKKSSPPFPCPASPSSRAVDGHGTVFDNIEDKSEIVRLDAHARKLTATWPAGCDSPSGLAFDIAGHRLFTVCDGKKMAVLDSNTGKVLATPAIGDGPDAARWDAKHNLAFASCGEGVLSVVDAVQARLSQPSKPCPRRSGARTMAYDPATDRVYLVTAELRPPPRTHAHQPAPPPRHDSRQLHRDRRGR